MNRHRVPAPRRVALHIAAAAAALLLFAVPAAGADWDIARLMGLLAHNKGGQTTFTEKKYIGMLDRPLASAGILVYQAPGHLEKRTLKPKPESFVLDGDVVTIRRPGKEYTLQLHDYPKVAVFIDSIRATLAGDRAALERDYHLKLTGTRERWTLILSPADSRTAGLIDKIIVGGRDGGIRSVEIRQPDGDRSVMTIGTAAPP